MLFLLVYSMIAMQMHAQYSGITGSWRGQIALGNDQLTLLVHIHDENGKLVATIDSPDQMATGIPVESVHFANDTLLLSLPALMASYTGAKQANGRIHGKWTQGGMTFDLNLAPTTEQAILPNRPQEPQPPFLYATEEVVFHNPKANINLAGTLSIPRGKGPHPGVVLISGSGPQNRDEEIAGHKPFLVLADFLARNGIASLRFDDRGVNQSEGNFASATSLDFKTDAAAALAFLQKQKRIDPERCGLIGHSEGGMIAQMMAADNDKLAFIVLLAAPGVPIPELMLKQAKRIARAQGASKNEIELSLASNRAVFDILLQVHDPDSARKLVNREMENLAVSLSGNDPGRKEMLHNQLQSGLDAVFTPWFLFFIKYKPEDYLSRVKCPVLALNGDKDIQVEAVSNIGGITEIIQRSGNVQLSTHILPGLNHLFQTAETGAPREYAEIEETFAPQALAIIADWINGL